VDFFAAGDAEKNLTFFDCVPGLILNQSSTFMKTTYWIIFSVVLGLFCSGCGGVQAPSDFPTLCPLVIVVQNNGQPVDQVGFHLIPENASVSWGIAGQTNSSGEGTVMTSQGTYSSKGCPEGKFTVILTEPPVVTGLELTEEESRRMTQEESDAHAAKLAEARRNRPKIVPATLGSSSSKPVVVDVTKETKKIVLELSEYSN
jgi:hypothetical protein